MTYKTKEEGAQYMREWRAGLRRRGGGKALVRMTPALESLLEAFEKLSAYAAEGEPSAVYGAERDVLDAAGEVLDAWRSV